MTSTQNMKYDGMSQNILSSLPHIRNENINKFDVSPVKVKRIGTENAILPDLVKLLRGELQQTRAESQAQPNQLTKHGIFLMSQSIKQN